LRVETASRRNDLVNQLPASNVHQLTGISTNMRHLQFAGLVVGFTISLEFRSGCGLL
jgi:hypothetical protein